MAKFCQIEYNYYYRNAFLNGASYLLRRAGFAGLGTFYSEFEGVEGGEGGSLNTCETGPSK